MKYRLAQNLGTDDAKFCNERFGAGFEIGSGSLEAGTTIELSDGAAKYLSGKYPALLEEVRPVRGITEAPKVKGIVEVKAGDLPKSAGASA